MHLVILLLSILNHSLPLYIYGAMGGLWLGVVGMATFNFPGVKVTESTLGALPIPIVGGNVIKLVGTCRRGPINTPTLVTNMRNALAIFGPEDTSGYLLAAIRGVLETCQNGILHVVRVAGAGATAASATLTASTNASWTVAPNCTSFTLTFGAQTTSSLTTATLTAAALQTALATLTSIGANNVSVSGNTGGPFTVTLIGTLANTTETAGALTSTPTGGAALCPIAQTTPGGPVNVLKVTALGPGVAYNYAQNNASWSIVPDGVVTAFTLTFNGQTTGSLMLSGLTTSAVQTALQALSTIGAGNCTVTGSTGGPFVVTLAGTLVNTPEPANVLSATGTGGSVAVSQVTSGGASSGVAVTYSNGLLTVYADGKATETYPNVLQGANTQTQAAQRINGVDQYVNVTWLNSVYNPDNTTSPAGLASGTDGSAVIDATYVGSPAGSGPGGTGIYAFENRNNQYGAPGIICVPGITTNIVMQALLQHAINWRDLAIIDSTFGNSTQAAINERNQYADDQGHALYCYGWLQKPDLDTGALRWQPRSAPTAALIVRSHTQPGSLANVGAGIGYNYTNTVALEVDLDDITNGQLNIAGIDCARDMTQQGQGLVHWGARTISTNPLYTFLQVRMIFNVLAVTIEDGLKPYVFKPVDGKGKMARDVKGSLNGLLWTLWSQDVLFGDTAKDAFHVVTETQDPSLLEQGIFEIAVYAKPTPIAERLAVSLYRVPIAFNFQTNQVDVGAITLGNQVG